MSAEMISPYVSNGKHNGLTVKSTVFQDAAAKSDNAMADCFHAHPECS